MGAIPGLLMTAGWLVVTAAVYYALARWSGPTIVWTIVPGVAKGLRDWASREHRPRGAGSDAGAPSAEPNEAGSAGPAATPAGGEAEIIEL
jgi:hypothetical protein